MMRKLIWTLVCCLLPIGVEAQALRGTTGLLHAPTAVMEKDKTFKFGGNVLHLTPLRYFSSKKVDYTFNYYLNITFFPWLEVGYTCTLVYFQEWGYTNQDRAFYGRLRLWKEGCWKEWTPQIVLGLDDPGTHKHSGGGDIGFRDESGQNAHFMRYYLAMTKHIDFKGIGILGTHLSYVLDMPAWHPEAKGLASGVNFRFALPGDQFWQKAVNGLNLMAEYDARTINVGGTYSIWKDRINLVAELNDGKYFSGGLYFKVCLK